MIKAQSVVIKMQIYAFFVFNSKFEVKIMICDDGTRGLAILLALSRVKKSIQGCGVPECLFSVSCDDDEVDFYGRSTVSVFVNFELSDQVITDDYQITGSTLRVDYLIDSDEVYFAIGSSHYLIDSQSIRSFFFTDLMIDKTQKMF